jgi:hypothetical protein
VRAAGVVVLLTLLVSGLACRRENPAPGRTATAQAAAAATAAAMPTATPAPTAAAVAAPGAAPAPGAGRRGKISGGNLGVAASGISAGIQMWSKAGGVLAGGATMTGTIQDGTEVEIAQEEQFLGQRYYLVRAAGKEGWVEARFVEAQ